MSIEQNQGTIERTKKASSSTSTNNVKARTRVQEFLWLCDKFRFVGYSFERIGVKYVNGRPEKDPIGQRKGYQTVTSNDYKQYIRADHTAFGFITNARSGITVVDCDTTESYNQLVRDFPHIKDTLTAETRKGRHLYFKYDPRPKSGYAFSVCCCW
jgi:hypothetical protein